MDMILIVRRLQRLGRERGVPLSRCFIDPQKTHDSIDRALEGTDCESAKAGVRTKLRQAGNGARVPNQRLLSRVMADKVEGGARHRR